MGFIKIQLQTPLKQLSGGEATRVAMAEMFIKPTNVLVLDEPTNFIDVFTIEALEALEVFLKNYPGTVIFTSHDDKFVNRVAQQIYKIDNQTLHHIL